MVGSPTSLALPTSIHLSVVEVDAKECQADVLALTHAQAFFGRRSLDLVGLQAKEPDLVGTLKAQSEVYLRDAHGVVKAPAILFVNIPGRSKDGALLEEAARDRLRSVGYDSATKPHIFVAMPFSSRMVAWGCKRPTVLLAQDEAHLKFDVKGHKCLFYNSIRDLEQCLSKELLSLKESV